MGRTVREPTYTDWFSHIDRLGGPLAWVSRAKDFPVNTSVHARPTVRNGSQIKNDVLQAPRVQETIREETEIRGCDRKHVEAEAKEILDTMGHDFNLRAVRIIGYMVAKVIRRIFDGIYVNFEDLQKIRELCKTDSVVFMPSHKSYMDFLLLSLLCFDQDVPLPAIAAGMDFMNSKFMGEALRKCGAFFIRRSFGTDKLYWALFTEYVQTHLNNSDRPVEFFVEGTRSRVGKSIFPKYGLMQVMLEPYLRGTVYDLVIVPVAMNYDKILEEILYGYELLGFPKPKESTSGLFKATKILNESFGRCYVTFCEPISVRKHFGLSLHRAAFVSQPDSQFVLSSREKKAIRKLGHLIVREHNANSVISVWPFACQCILQFLDDPLRGGITFSELLAALKAQLALMERLGVVIQIDKSIEEDLRYYVQLHSDLFEPETITDIDFSLKLLDQSIANSGSIDKEAMEKSVGRIVLTNYANKMMHEIANSAMISTILCSTTEHQQNIVYGKFVYLQAAMARDFVNVPEEELSSFSAALDQLKLAKIIQIQDQTIQILDAEAVLTLRNLIQPAIANFYTVLDVVAKCGERYVTQAQIIQISQQAISERWAKNWPDVRISALSTDPIKNAFGILESYRILSKKAKNYEVVYPKLDEPNWLLCGAGTSRNGYPNIVRCTDTCSNITSYATGETIYDCAQERCIRGDTCFFSRHSVRCCCSRNFCNIGYPHWLPTPSTAATTTSTTQALTTTPAATTVPTSTTQLSIETTTHRQDNHANVTTLRALSTTVDPNEDAITSCFTGVTFGFQPEDRWTTGALMSCEGVCTNITFALFYMPITAYICDLNVLCRVEAINDSCKYILDGNLAMTMCCCDTSPTCSVAPSTQLPTPLPAVPTKPISNNTCFIGFAFENEVPVTMNTSIPAKLPIGRNELCDGDCANITLGNFGTLYTCDPISVCVGLGITNNCGEIVQQLLWGCCCSGAGCNLNNRTEPMKTSRIPHYSTTTPSSATHLIFQTNFIVTLSLIAINFGF